MYMLWRIQESIMEVPSTVISPSYPPFPIITTVWPINRSIWKTFTRFTR
uniref:Uncharacterized protein n=1 Tax=Rhizophora mucronata TaxID=61149 RepID=A0A2P2KC81_RHIMU